jgi:hypothetical protein
VKKFMSALLLAVGCGAPQFEGSDVEVDQFSQEEAAITSVNQSKVERQSIGNCWIYAATGWAEALNRDAAIAGQPELNLSQSYITYFNWFDQIANSRISSIQTGGSYELAIRLFDRYGLMLEGAFVPEEATAEMSNRQKLALDRINASLKSGALADTTKRRDRAFVRAELDKAFGLNSEVVATLDTVFGKDVSKTMSRSYSTTVPPTGTRANGEKIQIMRTQDIKAQLKKNVSGTATTAIGTLADAIGYSRGSTMAWRSLDYPYDTAGRRSFQKRVQRALHDKQPVIVSWFVDFNALGRDSTFELTRLQAAGPGRQGGHMVVMHDYEVDNVPGFGTLKAGVDEVRPEALNAALSDSATVKFFRIKNSWGAVRSDRWDTSALPGYHDLYLNYLNGPVKQCSEKADGTTDTTSCYDTTPLWDVVLPAGY